jgi:uncharacterized membrane protein
MQERESVDASVQRIRQLILLLVGIGVLLRVAQYVSNRSLWVDEAWLALNLLERSLGNLSKPLDFNQAAPIGFLYAEGIAKDLFGSSEYVLRLFPLICGVVSVAVFAWVARHILSGGAALLAVLLFVVADGLIYYSSEVKPYETDVAVAVGLVAVSVLLAQDTAPGIRWREIILTLTGLPLIALSFPAVFIVAAIATTFLIRAALKKRRGGPFAGGSLAAFVWGLASLGIAVFGVTGAGSVRASFEENPGRFLGARSSSPLHALNVMGTNIANAIGFWQEPPASQLTKLALVCFVIGAVALLLHNPVQLSILSLPFGLLFFASAAHLYPISTRTELFLVPAVVLLIAEGVAETARRVPRPGRLATAILLATAVAVGPVWLAGKRLVHPRTHQEIKPVLEYVRNHWRAGDTLYVHYGAQYALLYYDECKCVRLTSDRSHRELWPLSPSPRGRGQYAQAAISPSSRIVVGRYFGVQEQPYLKEIERLAGRGRVWFVYSQFSYPGEQAFIERKLLPRLAKLGRLITRIDEPGAHADLYDLSSGSSSR